jgi:TolB-like protein/Flp pilus assembly protein TadD
MITARGQPKLMDFGLAKRIVQRSPAESQDNTESLLTAPGSMVGTVPYMSPEQMRGEELDARSDIFSFGAVLYEMMSGKHPFRRGTAVGTISAILTQDPPQLENHPEELQEIVRKALAKEKEKRYQSSQELLADLRRLSEALDLEIKLRRSGPVEASGGSFAEDRVRSAVQTPAPSAAPSRRSRQAASTSPRQRKAIDSIAVLPLVNASDDRAVEFLSDGITESIINKLASLPRLRVMARSTVFRYKGRDTDPQQVGRELNVRAVLTGRMLSFDDRLIIKAELVDTADGSQIWGGQFTRAPSDIFAIEEEISREISDQLRLKLTSGERKRLAKRHTQNAEAYELYLRGRHFYHQWTAEGIEQAIANFERAIDKEPNYALAYAGLADSYVSLWWFGYVPPQLAVPKIRTAIMKALEIDESLSEIHAAHARVRECYDWDWINAEREFKRAIELNPNSADARMGYATFLASMERFNEARVEGKHALELDPLSLSTNLTLGWALYYFPREYEKALEHGRRILEMEPGFFGAHWIMGAALNLLGMYEESIAEHQKALDLGGGTHVLSGLGSVYARWGKRDEALKIIDQLKALKEQTYIPAYHIAMVYSFLGDRDEAFEYLEMAFRERNGTLAFLKTDCAMDNLKGDPRLADLMRRIGLE